MAIRIAKTTVTMAKTTNNNSVRRIPAPTQRALGVFIPPSDTDINGSYTGKPKNESEIPVQDADDL